MALTSPALVTSIETMFAAIRPTLGNLSRIGATDFAADAPTSDVKPGSTIKYPISSIAAAAAFDPATNNYETGGSTTWGTMTATHYLQGFDISGVNVDEGVSLPRMKQLFARRAGLGIAYAIETALTTALDTVTASTAVTLPATGVTLADYSGLAAGISWLDRGTSCLVLNGASAAELRALYASGGIVAADINDLAKYLGFGACVVVPGMTARACVVPISTVAFIGRVPTIIARYTEAGTEIDPETGLAVGVVVADVQSTNKQIVNADLWFGVATVGASANASTTKGIIKIA